LQNKKFVTIDVKNKKHVDLIHQQIALLKDAETNQSSRRAIKTALNPRICPTCLENNFLFELNSKGRLCFNCFEKEFGKILMLPSNRANVEYIGGNSDYVLTGKDTVAGKMYLTENYIIFAKDDKDLSKKREIIIPLDSIMIHGGLEEQMRQKYRRWEATPLDSFGFGSSFMRPTDGSASRWTPDRLVITYFDKNGQTQEPEFRISFIQHWAASLYKMTIKAKIVSSQQYTLKDGNNSFIQTSANCLNCNRKFRIYDLNICGHCMTSFCDECENNHSIKSELEFNAEYIGGHKRYALDDSLYTKLYVFSDRIEVGGLFRILYTHMTNIENVDEKRLSALRVVGLGLVGALWKKKHIYTIIQYMDGYNEEQRLILDFGGRILEAQQIIYDRMLASRRTKN